VTFPRLFPTDNFPRSSFSGQFCDLQLAFHSDRPFFFGASGTSAPPRKNSCLPRGHLQCRSDLGPAHHFFPLSRLQRCTLVQSIVCRAFSFSARRRMPTTSLKSFANSYSPFPPQTKRMTQSQTPGLDTLAEGSQYALEQLQLAREAGAAANTPTDSASSLADSKPPQHSQHLLYTESHNSGSGLKDSQSRDSLADARSAIRKNSSAGTVRRRISRACDQCNQLRTKCDGNNPCAHCVGKNFPVMPFLAQFD
jgi:hypothetical protein